MVAATCAHLGGPAEHLHYRSCDLAQGLGLGWTKAVIRDDEEVRIGGDEEEIAAEAVLWRPNPAGLPHSRSADRLDLCGSLRDHGVLTDWYLARQLEGLQANKVWIVMAACYGGGFTEAAEAIQFPAEIFVSFRRFLSRRGYTS